MKVIGVISTTALFLLLGATLPAFAQEEHHEEAAKPAKQEAAKPAKPEAAKPENRKLPNPRRRKRPSLQSRKPLSPPSRRLRNRRSNRNRPSRQNNKSRPRPKNRKGTPVAACSNMLNDQKRNNRSSAQRRRCGLASGAAVGYRMSVSVQASVTNMFL